MLLRVVQNREVSMSERSTTQHSLWSRKIGQNGQTGHGSYSNGSGSSRSLVASVSTSHSTGGLTADILQSHDRSMKGGKKGIDRSDNDIRESLADGTLVVRDRAAPAPPPQPGRRNGGNAGLSPSGATATAAVTGRSPNKQPPKAGKTSGESGAPSTAAAGATAAGTSPKKGNTSTNTTGGRAGRGDRGVRASTKSKAKQASPRATRGTRTGSTKSHHSGTATVGKFSWTI